MLMVETDGNLMIEQWIQGHPFWRKVEILTRITGRKRQYTLFHNRYPPRESMEG
jgi:hypothetical protein